MDGYFSAYVNHTRYQHISYRQSGQATGVPWLGRTSTGFGYTTDPSQRFISEVERPRVKLQCLRLLTTLRLEPAKTALISRFVDSYLNLQPDEVRIFDQILETIPEVEKQEVMEITTSWQRQGRVEGRVEGRLEGLREGLTSALRALFGERAEPLTERLQDYDLESLQSLKQRLVPGVRLEDLSQP